MGSDLEFDEDALWQVDGTYNSGLKQWVDSDKQEILIPGIKEPRAKKISKLSYC